MLQDYSMNIPISFIHICQDLKTFFFYISTKTAAVVQLEEAEVVNLWLSEVHKPFPYIRMRQGDIYHIHTNTPTPTQKQFDFAEKNSIKTRKGAEIVQL